MSTFYTSLNPRNSPDKTLKLMFTMTRSKVNAAGAPDDDQGGHGLPCTAQPTEDQIPACFAVEPGHGSVVELVHMPE